MKKLNASKALIDELAEMIFALVKRFQRLRLAQAALREQRPRPAPDDETDHIPWSVYFADRLRHVDDNDDLVPRGYL